MLPCHDRCDKRCDDIGEALIRSDDGCGCEALIVVGCLRLLGGVRAVPLVGVGGQGAQPDGHARGLEVGRVEGDDANNIVVVWLQVLNRDRRLLW